MRANPILDDDGNMVAIAGVITDITAEREAATPSSPPRSNDPSPTNGWSPTPSVRSSAASNTKPAPHCIRSSASQNS
ncbi:MAG: hypothetical protein R2710_11940 [Acidimicrobiales bacterium]